MDGGRYDHGHFSGRLKRCCPIHDNLFAQQVTVVADTTGGQDVAQAPRDDTQHKGMPALSQLVKHTGHDNSLWLMRFIMHPIVPSQAAFNCSYSSGV